MSLVGLRTAEPTVTPSHAESARFGFPVGRLVVSETADARIDLEAALEIFELVIVRVHARHCGWTFHQDPGALQIHHADTLLYLGGPNVQSDTSASVRGLSPLVELTETNTAELSEALADSFTGYTNHYSRNPTIADGYLLEGYLEWGISHLTSPTGQAFAIRSGGQIASFACMEVDQEIAEVSLAATRQRHRGQRLYSTLLRELESEFPNQQLVISTQLSNTAVVRIWRSLGWTDIGAYHTYHATRR